jgi:Flp pilus assembly protein TadG
MTMLYNDMAGRRQLSRRALAAIVDDTRGSPAIEFAIIAPMFIALLLAIIQIALFFFAQQNLETVAENSVRKLMTGNAQQANMTQAQFKNIVCADLPSFMKCANLMIDVRTATSFSDADTDAPTITYDSAGKPTNLKFAPGGAGSIVIVKTMYVWDVADGPLGFDISNMSNGRRLLIATSVFKTEQYA